MTSREIVETLGRERRVENICLAMTHLRADDPDLLDLGQHIYMILLQMDEGKLVDLWEHGEINFFIVRLILNNFRSGKSRFHYLFRVFRERSVPLDGIDFPDK